MVDLLNTCQLNTPTYLYMFNRKHSTHYHVNLIFYSIMNDFNQNVIFSCLNRAKSHGKKIHKRN